MIILLVGVNLTSLIGQSSSGLQKGVKKLPYKSTLYLNDGTILNCSVIEENDERLKIVLTCNKDTLSIESKDLAKRTVANNAVNSTYARSRYNRKYHNAQQKRGRRLIGNSKLPLEAYIKTVTTDYGIVKVISDDNYKLKIIDAEGDTTELYYIKIQKLFKKKKNATYYDNGSYHFDKGAFFRSAIGKGINEDASYITLEGIMGMRLNKVWSVGAGYSLEFFGTTFGDITDESIGFSNLFAYGRYNFTDKKVRFFASAKLGYPLSNLNSDNNHEYTAFVNFTPSLGLVLASKNNRKDTIEVDFATQYVEGHYTTRFWQNRNVQEANGESKNLMNRPFMKICVDM